MPTVLRSTRRRAAANPQRPRADGAGAFRRDVMRRVFAVGFRRVLTGLAAGLFAVRHESARRTSNLGPAERIP
jgi:hypothetical protein